MSVRRQLDACSLLSAGAPHPRYTIPRRRSRRRAWPPGPRRRRRGQGVVLVSEPPLGHRRRAAWRAGCARNAFRLPDVGETTRAGQPSTRSSRRPKERRPDRRAGSPIAGATRKKVLAPSCRGPLTSSASTPRRSSGRDDLLHAGRGGRGPSPACPTEADGNRRGRPGSFDRLGRYRPFSPSIAPASPAAATPGVATARGPATWASHVSAYRTFHLSGNRDGSTSSARAARRRAGHAA